MCWRQVGLLLVVLRLYNKSQDSANHLQMYFSPPPPPHWQTEDMGRIIIITIQRNVYTQYYYFSALMGIFILHTHVYYIKYYNINIYK